MAEYTISYSNGWPDWYVSEFYKYFHRKLEETTGRSFDYIELRDLNKQYKLEDEISSDSVFGHYSLIIRKNSNGKLFVHSWYDHAFATLEWCERNNLDVVLFSGVSNINQNFISSRSNVQPSVYCLEYWSDHERLNLFENTAKQNLKAYFAGLPHGVRVHIMETLAQNIFFEIHDKTKLYIQKNDYYKKIADSYFGLSFNGAANICYRDLELFKLKTLNLRQPLNCLTYEPIVENVHYYNFLDESLTQKIISYHAFNQITKEDICNLVQDKVTEVTDFFYTKHYTEMIEESYRWFQRNCTPQAQFNIIFSFLKEFSIFN